MAVAGYRVVSIHEGLRPGTRFEVEDIQVIQMPRESDEVRGIYIYIYMCVYVGRMRLLLSLHLNCEEILAQHVLGAIMTSKHDHTVFVNHTSGTVASPRCPT